MKNLILLFTISFLLIGCGGSKEVTSKNVDLDEAPEWYDQAPSDPNYLFAVSSATSKDMQMAVDKASTSARAEIGIQVEAKIQGLQKKFDEETGLGEDAQYLSMFTEATKIIVSTTISGSKIDKRKTLKEGNIFRAYVLVSYPIGAANQALVDQIKKNEQMYTRYRATKTFEELDKETEKFEQFKKGE